VTTRRAINANLARIRPSAERGTIDANELRCGTQAQPAALALVILLILHESIKFSVKL